MPQAGSLPRGDAGWPLHPDHERESRSGAPQSVRYGHEHPLRRQALPAALLTVRAQPPQGVVPQPAWGGEEGTKKLALSANIQIRQLCLVQAQLSRKNYFFAFSFRHVMETRGGEV